jgi:hypothetical protein
MVKVRNLIKYHLEWSVLCLGLILLAFMNPEYQGTSLCIIEVLEFYCPGEGLGRSISYIFRGMWIDAFTSNPAGYLAVPVLTGRIIYIIKNRISNSQLN